MPAGEFWIVFGVLSVFGVFAIALAYVNFVAGDRARTFDEERAGRHA